MCQWNIDIIVGMTSILGESTGGVLIVNTNILSFYTFLLRVPFNQLGSSNYNLINRSVHLHPRFSPFGTNINKTSSRLKVVAEKRINLKKSCGVGIYWTYKLEDEVKLKCWNYQSTMPDHNIYKNWWYSSKLEDRSRVLCFVFAKVIRRSEYSKACLLASCWSQALVNIPLTARAFSSFG